MYNTEEILKKPKGIYARGAKDGCPFLIMRHDEGWGFSVMAKCDGMMIYQCIDYDEHGDYLYEHYILGVD